MLDGHLLKHFPSFHRDNSSALKMDKDKELETLRNEVMLPCPWLSRRSCDLSQF